MQLQNVGQADPPRVASSANAPAKTTVATTPTGAFGTSEEHPVYTSGGASLTGPVLAALIGALIGAAVAQGLAHWLANIREQKRVREDRVTERRREYLHGFDRAIHAATSASLSLEAAAAAYPHQTLGDPDLVPDLKIKQVEFTSALVSFRARIGRDDEVYDTLRTAAGLFDKAIGLASDFETNRSGELARCAEGFTALIDRAAAWVGTGLLHVSEDDPTSVDAAHRRTALQG